MAPLKVYGSPTSTATQRVLSVIYEKGLEYDFATVNLRTGEHKQEPYLSINPFGQIPGFKHGDLTLFESRAINRYLNEEFADKGTQLIAANRGHSFVWTEVEGQQYGPIASKLVGEIIFKPKFLGAPTDEAAVKEYVEKLEKVLDIYEARLTKSKFLAGDTFCIADLHHQPSVQLLTTTPYKAIFDARPHVAKWAAYILSRPAWAKVLALQKQ